MSEDIPVPEAINTLVQRFELYLPAYLRGQYKEIQLRREYIDPFFKSLGWDVDNNKGYSEAYKEVVHEDPIRIQGSTLSIDYSFRIGGARKFIVEAKKPSVNIYEDDDGALQIRRYAWNAKLPLSILTDFEEFAVYDCTKRPLAGDKASDSRIAYFTYKDYPQKWTWIVSIFSQESILHGSFDRFAESTKGKHGTATVDEAFLTDIEDWRDQLAKNLALRNPSLNVDELNIAVQKTIDRIIFLRICEDRGIEPYGCLQKLLEGSDVHRRLLSLFQRADDRYNSGLFHFHEEAGWDEMPDGLTPSLLIDDGVLKDIIKRLYYPVSPYEFSVISPVILGQVYEQFLGKVIRLTEGHRAKVEYKPEVKKAHGVYYTPQYIVDYIIQQTVGELIKGKTPFEVSSLHLLDPACGSGTFLLGAYQYLLSWHLDWYIQNLVPLVIDKGATAPEVIKILPPLTHDEGGRSKNVIPTLPIYKSANGSTSRVRSDWRLTTAERKRILINNIYGVDIDLQAVEVTKLSLLLKVLEEENEENVSKQVKLFAERALPSLHKNIKCGNSLVGTDLYSDVQLTIDDPGLPKRVNAFDWDQEFQKILRRGGFDAVIGNPPYVFGGNYGIEKDLKKYFKEHFTAGSGKINLFTLFIEKSTNILRNGGLLSFIIPNTLLRVTSYETIREFILEKTAIKKIVDLGVDVFPGTTTSSIVIVLAKDTNVLKNIVEIHIGIDGPAKFAIQSDFLSNIGYVLNIKTTSQGNTLLNKLNKEAVRLGGLCKEMIFGVVISKNRDEVVSNKPLNGYKPFLEGKDISRYSIHRVDKYILYKPELLHRPRTAAIFEAREKILIQRITGGIRPLNATYDNQQYYDKESINNIILRDDVTYNPKYILGLINSQLMNWFYRNKFTNESTLTVNLSKEYLSELPIQTIDFSDPVNRVQHDTMVTLVDRMLTLHKQQMEAKTDHEKTLIDRQIEAADRQIDGLVYELYSLTDEEIAIVEER
jgi:hypothetical protein